jgi:alpha-L-fucosidase
MKRIVLIVLLIQSQFGFGQHASLQDKPLASSSLNWFNEARFGLFIHWGLYSVPARGEWVMNRERIPKEEYLAKYADGFTARQYKPAEWCALAREAGMKYIVLTARHHDGFCLWNTKTTNYNTLRYGPKKDLIKEYVEAARKAGLKIGFYYSVADWTHPDYFPFERDWPVAFRNKEASERYSSYYREQVKELMTNYGKIDLLWFDGPVPETSEQRDSTNRMVLKLQPDILINDRNGGVFHYRTSEQKITAGETSTSWEACFTLNENWGYHATDTDYKTAKEVLRTLISCAGSGGNLLLNVGPRPDGTIPESSVAVIQEAGSWLKENKSFLANSERHGFERLWNNSLLVTVKQNKLYLHFTAVPPESDFCYAEIKNKVLRIYLLKGEQPLEFLQQGDRLFIKNLSVHLTDPLINTVVIETEGKPVPVKTR